MGEICDSSLNCEMSKLESICEEVLEDEENSDFQHDLNDSVPGFRKKRNISPSPNMLPSETSKMARQNVTSRPKHSTANNVGYKKPKSKMTWVLRRRRKRRRRRRRRRSRIRLLFKMIGIHSCTFRLILFLNVRIAFHDFNNLFFNLVKC